MVVVRRYCHLSLESKTTYTVYHSENNKVMFLLDGVRALGEACSHVATLLFYIVDAQRRAVKHPSSDRTVIRRSCATMTCASKEKHSTQASFQVHKQLCKSKCTQSTMLHHWHTNRIQLSHIITCGESESCLCWE